jgi:hypothetical protein
MPIVAVGFSKIWSDGREYFATIGEAMTYPMLPGFIRRKDVHKLRLCEYPGVEEGIIHLDYRFSKTRGKPRRVAWWIALITS